MTSFAFGSSITVLRTAKDPRTGDPLPEPATHTIDGCAIGPRGSSEAVNLGDAVIEGYTVLAPYGADILATDEVLLPGDSTPWQVEGEPGHWRSPFTGWAPGTQVALSRQRG